MKIHSDTLTGREIMDATKARGMRGVRVDKLDTKGSRQRARRWDVTLEGNSAFRQNFGENQAATWDEWGIFIEALFQLDPDAVIGQYASFNDFRRTTGARFSTLWWEDSHKRHTWKSEGNYTSSCKCGATQDWSSLMERRGVTV